jgi:choline dehydrogenase-like flavoprotein
LLIDARGLDRYPNFDCDLCIVGAGICGLALADELRAAHLSIVLLESGGINYELPTQALYRGEQEGQAYFRLDGCRWRMFGGSSNRWGGWCRPLDEIDFERRPWLEHSGWPIEAKALEPYEGRAAELLELADPRFELEAWRHRLPAPLPLEGTQFENILIQHSPETNFAERYGRRVCAAANITVLLHANLIALKLAPLSSRVSELKVATLTGRHFSVCPRAVVLATGGIENARLLLASQADRGAGLGNEFDQVGRYFMEHLHMPFGHVLLRPGVGDNRFYRRTRLSDAQVRGVIKPTASAQSAAQRLAASFALENASFFQGTPFLGWPPRLLYAPVVGYHGLRRARLAPLANALKHALQRVHSVPTRVRTWRRARAAHARGRARGPVYSLYVRAEQAPHPANRVTLSAQRDELGVPLSRLQWRIQPLDSQSVTGWLGALDRDLRASGLGHAEAPPENWTESIVGGPHHMGTTRMSREPRTGVVDADCRVHSVSNLYLAGSSLFTTSGHANPTFTILTLALRLARTLRTLLEH